MAFFPHVTFLQCILKVIGFRPNGKVEHTLMVSIHRVRKEQSATVMTDGWSRQSHWDPICTIIGGGRGDTEEWSGRAGGETGWNSALQRIYLYAHACVCD